jgi:predicted ThiF/HesA family dinucleotide-utilizing enzyme
LLGQVEAIALALDIDAKEEPKLTKVLDGKLRVQVVNDLLEQHRAGAREHHVIDIQKEVDNVMATSKHEQGRVGACRSEADADHERGKTSEPRLRCLSKPVHRLVEEADSVWPFSINKPDGLLT